MPKAKCAMPEQTFRTLTLHMLLSPALPWTYPSERKFIDCSVLCRAQVLTCQDTDCEFLSWKYMTAEHSPS